MQLTQGSKRCDVREDCILEGAQWEGVRLISCANRSACVSAPLLEGATDASARVSLLRGVQHHAVTGDAVRGVALGGGGGLLALGGMDGTASVWRVEK